ncbi:MAG: MoxR family ATPase [Thermodesulfobacteriota bacterium]|nr:MoxR family ATPase [Thermodesulfobacteriota bacterium]
MDEDKAIKEITGKVEEKSILVKSLFGEMEKIIVGQQYMLERIFIGILSNGHVLVEGVPGLAKTTAVKTLAACINTGFRRIQFTPDMLPADLIGTQIFHPKDGAFFVKKGPIFSNIILADEINRAPAKVQSALLEAMQERQVTIGEETFVLEEPFLVLATQNPIEQEGTYPLPEAQVDRFMMKLKITYPDKSEEKIIMERADRIGEINIKPVITPSEIFELRTLMDNIYIEEKLNDYIIDLVFSTRQPMTYNIDENLIQYGASPRASIYIKKAVKALAFLNGRGYVVPQDIKDIGRDILRHRIILTYEAEAENMNTDDLITQIFDRVEVP